MRKLWVLSFALLAGCAGNEGVVSQSTPSPAPNVAASAAPVMVKADPVQGESKPTPQAQISRLLNHTPADVQMWLGRPAFVRRDGQTQMLQFMREACVLDVYFFRTSSEQDFLANHIDARSLKGVSVDKQSCFLGLLKEGVNIDALLPQVSEQTP